MVRPHSSHPTSGRRARPVRTDPPGYWLAGLGGRRPDSAPMARILVTEKIADGGLDRLRDAGHDVDVQLDLTPEQLVEAVKGAHALIIRSATEVTAEVLAAGQDLVVVGRAGIGLDNVDADAATTQGVMVVNAPQSNILTTAEHTMALLLAQARNIPQAHAALIEGRWERSRWEGVELADKVLGIVGLGRIGKLVAQRASAFGMKVVAHDPFVAPERARQINVELLEPRGAGPRGRLPHAPRGEDARDPRHGRQGAPRPGQAEPPHHQRVARRRDRRGRPGRGHPRGPHRRRRPRRVRHRADHQLAAVRAAAGGRHPAPRCQHRRGPGQGGRHHRRAGRPRAGRRVRALRRERERRRGVEHRAPVPAARRAARPALRRAGRGRPRRASRSATRASWPTPTPASSRSRCSRASSARSARSR